jgi:response regulator RpfG family c-di-GMP phosphodiesterase
MRSDPRERTVLVVEDDEAVRSIVETHLRKRRFKVRAVSSAEEVLADLRDRKLDYDLALVDVHLPAMSGVELSRLLLAARPLSAVLIITGDDDAGLAREALNGGATGYLLKPFQLFELDAAVSQAVSMRDLVETTETLARSQSQGLNDWGESGGSLPRSWLHVGDEQSGAGAGHGARVVSIAGLLAKKLGDERIDGRDRDLLRTAARTHEIGRITGGGSPVQVARRTAQLLEDLGFDGGVCEMVRQAVEPWSPGLPLSARLLSVADALDHEAVRREAAGAEAAEAVVAAIDALEARSGEAYDPTVVGVLKEQREQVESMWVLQRQVAGT